VRRQLVGSGLAALILCAAPTALADLFRWVDARGQLHVTDDLSQVPPAQRAEAERQSNVEKLEELRQARQAAPVEPAAAPLPAALAAAPILLPVPARPVPRRHEIAVARAGLELGVTALLEGRLNAPFKVDTGATINTIPRAVVDELGITIDESTPRIAVAGIDAVPRLVPIVTISEVRLGDAAVEQVEAAVLDTLEYGLLGMPFFNHFRTQVDPSAGRLVLEEIDLAAVDGVHGGYGEGYWRGRFRMIREQQERIARIRAALPEHFGEFHAQLDVAERYWLSQELDLEERASRADVPRAWRE
jgi:hypothetical protein